MRAAQKPPDPAWEQGPGLKPIYFEGAFSLDEERRAPPNEFGGFHPWRRDANGAFRSANREIGEPSRNAGHVRPDSLSALNF